jgi:uncharacterized protein YjbI with pentapeptide repeats
MMTDEGNRIGDLPAKQAPVSVETLQALFKSNSDIGHRIFADATLESAVARQSIFPGAIFRGCEIVQCDFSRSDFEGVRFEKCRIDRTSFEYCDIRSTTFASCEIVDCSFEGAYFSDNIIKDGVLKACNFNHATMTSNQFVSTRLISLTNKRATMLHNDWVSSFLEDMKLGDCTSLYNYFESCRFAQFRINADALGLSFGLSADDLLGTDLIFLGREEQKPFDADLVDQLIAEFESRLWQLNAIVTKLNFGRVSPLAGWSMLFGFLNKSILEGNTRLDDVTFVLHVAEHLASEAQLPFFAVVSAHDSLADAVPNQAGATTEARALHRLRSGLASLVGSMQERFLEGGASLWELGAEEQVTVELVFQKKPEVHPGEYIELLVRHVIDAPTPVKFLGGRPGSWYEIIQTTVLTVLALYTVLFLLEGALIRLLLIRARLAQLASPKLPRKFIEKANDPRQTLPRDLVKIIGPLFNAISNGSIPLPGRKLGLSAKNLQEIFVKPSKD